MRKQPAAAINWAFKEYFRTPPAEGDRKWFPEEWEILALFRKWHEVEEDSRTKAYLERLRQDRESGQTVSYQDVLKLIRETAAKTGGLKKMPEKSE